MRLRKSKDNGLEFRKKLEKDIHGFNFKKFIIFIMKELDDDKSGSDNSQITSEEENDSDEEISDDGSMDAGEVAVTLDTIAGQTAGSSTKRRGGFIVNQ